MSPVITTVQHLMTRPVRFLVRPVRFLVRAVPPRALRWCFAGLLLIWLASPYWRQQIDDLFITLAFAWEWVQHGRIQWNTGQVVEGYSNFLLLTLLAGVAAMGGDGGFWAKGISLCSSLGLLGVAGAVLTRGRLGTLALLAIATWAPFGYWAAIGMETPLFALLLTAGWYLALQDGWRWGAGVWLLLLASLTRPEGLLFLILGGAAWIRQTRARPRVRAVVGAAFLAMLLYHAGRYHYFGSLVSTPALIKLEPIVPGQGGPRQLAREVPTMLGILAVMTAHRPRVRDIPWLLLPLAGCTALVLRANGDWMAWSRLMMPGLLATMVCWCGLGAPRAVSIRFASGLVALIGMVAMLEPAVGGLRLRSLEALGAPAANFTRGLDTPIEGDVGWLVENMPAGARVQASDVGMLGNVPDLSLFDSEGLADRDVAEWRAHEQSVAASRLLRLRLADPSSRPEAVRSVDWSGTLSRPADSPLAALYPAPLATLYPYEETIHYGGATVLWRRVDQRRPAPEVIVSRWLELHRRFPSQPFLTARLARALQQAGRNDDATIVLAEGSHRWPRLELFQEASAATSFSGSPPPEYVPGRGFALYWNRALLSRPLDHADLAHDHLVLDADAPGQEGASARLSWEPACAAAEDVAVTSRTSRRLEPPACTAGHKTIRLRVEFRNDGQNEAGDRNLYVSIHPGS